MGVNDELLPDGEYQVGTKVTNEKVLTIKKALEGDLFGRIRGQVVGSQVNIGSALYPIKTLHVNNILLEGNALDSGGGGGTSGGDVPIISEVVSRSSTFNAILSCKTSENSSQPKFIEVIPNTLNFKILGNDVPLELIIDGEPVTIDSDITVMNLEKAVPSLKRATPNIENIPASQDNDSAFVYDRSFAHLYERYAGEEDAVYGTSSNVGFFNFFLESNILDNFGNKTAFIINPVSYSANKPEIWTGYLSSNNQATQNVYNIRRQAAFLPDDSLCASISYRSAVDSLSNTASNTSEMLKTAWIFIDRDNVNVPRISYREPKIGSIAPTNNQSGDYWFNTTRNRWNVFGDDRWTEVNRLPIAEVYTSSTKIEGYRCYYTRKSFNKINTTEWEHKELLTYKTPSYKEGVVNVNGSLITIPRNTEVTGSDNTTSNSHYLYVKENGDSVFIKDHKPYYSHELRGYYHRGETWRCVAHARVSRISPSNGYTFSKDSLNGTFDNSYFPYQKYNTMKDNPLDFTFVVTRATQNSGSIIRKNNNVIPVTFRVTGGSLIFNIDSGFFLGVPYYQINTGSDINPAFVRSASISGGRLSRTFVLRFDTARPSSETITSQNIAIYRLVRSGTIAVTMSFKFSYSGIQEKQVRINNTLKHT